MAVIGQGVRIRDSFGLFCDEFFEFGGLGGHLYTILLIGFYDFADQ